MSLFVPPSGTIHPLWLMHYYWYLDTKISKDGCLMMRTKNRNIKLTENMVPKI